MNTETLIQRLAADLAPTPRHALARRVGLGVLAGGAVTLALVAGGLGFRPDIAAAAHGFAFWMKATYTAALGACTLAATMRLGRPEPADLRWLRLLVLPFASLALIAAVEMARVPAAGWWPMWLGRTWMVCPWLVFGLSLPIFLGLCWSFRRLAPTRLRATGAAAGAAAGATAATLYCLHCPETTALFVLTWYTAGIALAAGAGALAGPRLLRW